MVTAIYQRASDEKQDIDGVSIETQQDTIDKFIKYKGYQNLKIYTEIKSARQIKGRLKLQQLIKDIKDGRISRVVVYKLDRLTRSLRDLMNILHVFEENECELHSTYENIDTSSPSGRMLVQVLGMIAEWESANTSMRVSQAMQYRASQGYWQGSTPYGFDLVDSRLVPNEKEKEIVNQAFDLILKGNSPHYVTSKLNKRYSLDWGESFLIRKVFSPSTVGNIYRNGQTFEDTFEGLITKEKQKKLASILKSRQVGRNNKFDNDDLFRQRIRCFNCNSFLSLGAYKLADGSTAYRYTCDNCYRINRKSVCITEQKIENALLEYMSQGIIKFDEDDIKSNEHEKEIKRLRRRLDNLENQRDRIQRAWIQSRMSDDDLDKYQDEIDKEEMEIRIDLDVLSNAPDQFTEEEIESIRSTISEHFRFMTRIEKREFIQLHVKEIHFKRDLVDGYERKYDVRITNVLFL